MKIKPFYKLFFVNFSKFLIIINFFILNFENSYSPFIYPRQYGAEVRFKSYTFTDDGIYRLESYFDQPTLVELDDAETIKTMYPNHRCWQFKPDKNRLFIRAISRDNEGEICDEESSKVTLTVMTEGRKYFFALSSIKSKDPFENNLIFKFRYPRLAEDSKAKSASKGEAGNSIIQYAVKKIPNLKDPKNNFNYTASGDKNVTPSLIFDDGKFTYMKFEDAMPAVFSVDKDGREKMVNFRIVGPYLSVEGIYKVFSLRYGAVTTCIFNENLIQLDKIN